MTLPTIPLWAANAADLAALSDHGVVMLAAMLSIELRGWRRVSMQDLHATRTAFRGVVLGVDATLLNWATQCEALGKVLAHRVLYRRAVDEASRRGLVPDDAHLRVAIDAALADGRIDPEHLPVTLAHTWARCTMGGAESYISTGDVEAWLVSLRSMPVDCAAANMGGLQTAVTAAGEGLPAAIVEAGVQAERAAASMRAVVNMSAAEMREWSEATFDVPATEAFETERPHAPPIGRGVARRLGSERRRGR